jgi:hypothetical protein
MNKARLYQLVREGKLKRRYSDIPRIKSLLASAKSNIKAVKGVDINEETATLVFREYYESIRQVGDARWWSIGYEPRGSHEVSMEILMELHIKEAWLLKKLDRFRRTRNDANYRGYKISVAQAKEIADFWKICGTELIEKIEEAGGLGK